MAGPDEQHVSEKSSTQKEGAKAHPENLLRTDQVAAAEKSGGEVVGHALKTAPPLNHASDSHERHESVDAVPSIRQQFDVIVKLGKLYDDAPRGEAREALWKAYVKAVDTFRGAIGLKPINKAGAQFTLPLINALDSKDPDKLWAIFVEEKNTPTRVWDKIKRTPVVNFVVGVFGGAAELGHGVFTVVNEGRKSLGVGATKEEKEQAKVVMAAVGESFAELTTAAGLVKFGKAILRIDEYKEALGKDFDNEQGDTLGYVLGKHSFDLALVLTGGKAAQAALKKIGEKTGTRIATIAGELAEFEVHHQTATAAAMGTAAVAIEESAEQLLPKLAKQGVQLAEHAAKETTQELAKEVVKHAPHAAGGEHPEGQKDHSGDSHEIHAGSQQETKEKTDGDGVTKGPEKTPEVLALEMRVAKTKKEKKT